MKIANGSLLSFLFQFFNQICRDDSALDLICSFVNLRDFGVPHEFLHWPDRMAGHGFPGALNINLLYITDRICSGVLQTCIDLKLPHDRSYVKDHELKLDDFADHIVDAKYMADFDAIHPIPSPSSSSSMSPVSKTGTRLTTNE